MRGIKNIGNYLRTSDYYERRNLLITVLCATFSASISAFIAYQSSSESDSECMPDADSNLGKAFRETLDKVNWVLPIFGFGQTWSLTIFSILTFLTDQMLKVHKETLKNAAKLTGLFSKKAEHPYHVRLNEALIAMLVSEIQRLLDYVDRAPSGTIEDLARVLQERYRDLEQAQEVNIIANAIMDQQTQPSTLRRRHGRNDSRYNDFGLFKEVVEATTSKPADEKDETHQDDERANLTRTRGPRGCNPCTIL